MSEYNEYVDDMAHESDRASEPEQPYYEEEIQNDDIFDDNKIPQQTATLGAVDGDFKTAVQTILVEEFREPPPIHPGSTFMTRDDDEGADEADIRNERFLCWNQHGNVIQSEAKDKSYIEILRQRPDGSNERPNFADEKRFTHASLCNRGVLLARAGQAPELVPEGEAPETALLHFFDFQPWDVKKTWELNLSENEQIRSIACSDDVIVCCTTGRRRYLRLLSPAGVQMACLQLAGEAVACCASGSLVFVLTASHVDAASRNAVLNYRLFEVVNSGSKMCLISEGRFSPSPHSDVKWVGFSADSFPVVLDTSNVLFALTPAFMAPLHDEGVSQEIAMVNRVFDWTPILDFEQDGAARMEGTFVVRVGEEHAFVAICRDGEDAPRPSDRPQLRKIPLKIPLLGATMRNKDTQAAYEEERLRVSLRASNLEYAVLHSLLPLFPSALTHGAIEKGLDIRTAAEEALSQVKFQSDRAALRLFQRCLQGEAMHKALDAAQVLHNERSMNAAMQFALSNNKTRLYQKVNELHFRRFASLDQTTTETRGDDGFDDEGQVNTQRSAASFQQEAARVSERRAQVSRDSFRQPAPSHASAPGSENLPAGGDDASPASPVKRGLIASALAEEPAAKRKSNPFALRK